MRYNEKGVAQLVRAAVLRDAYGGSRVQILATFSLYKGLAQWCVDIIHTRALVFPTLDNMNTEVVVGSNPAPFFFSKSLKEVCYAY